MDDKKDIVIEIDKYYSSIDKSLLNNFCKNSNLKNLINLSTQTDIYIFNKKNKKWQLKSKNVLLKECDQIKKKELKVSSSMLSNLAKLNNTNDFNTVKSICQNLENKISNIDKIITYINNLDGMSPINSPELNLISNPNKYKPNIVSFNEINGTITNAKKTITNNVYVPKETIVSFNDINIKSNKNVFLENKIISLNLVNETKSSSLSDNYIECYGNC